MITSQALIVIALSSLLTTLSIAHGEEFADFSGTYQISNCEGSKRLTKNGRIEFLSRNGSDIFVENGDDLKISFSEKGDDASVETYPNRGSSVVLNFSTTPLTRVGDDESYSIEVSDRRIHVTEVRHQMLRETRETMTIRPVRVSIFGQMALVRKSQKRVLGIGWVTTAKAKCLLTQPIINMKDMLKD